MEIRELIIIIVVLVLAGALMWAIKAFLKMDHRIKAFIIGVIGFFAVVWALFQFLRLAGIQ